jgi:2-keto-4-pentenoate hydratase/2-oxohepta-3-ene-1,7-dioic acid hydratase in catechol pathway
MFGIGLNYRDHAVEAAFDIPEKPVVHQVPLLRHLGCSPKVVLPSDRVDYGVEVVVVIGGHGHVLVG